MAEEVLISVKIDRQGNQNELKNLTGQIIAQKNEIKQLETAIKTLNKAEGDNNELIKAATKNLEVKKQQLNQNVASQKALVNVVNAEVNSLNALRAQNAQLIRQRNQLNTETEEGRAGISRLNAQIDANNVKIRENSSALEKQKINVGNYASALSGISPGIAGFISGLQGITTASKAFIATPLGIVLAGIAVAVGPLISFFKDTAIGADRAAEESEGLGFVIDGLKDSINSFGEEQADVFDGLIASFLAANPALGALVNSYNAAAEAGREYARALDEINDRQSEFNVEAAFEQNEIAKLIILSKDRTKTEAERVAILDQILQREGQLAIRRKQFADDELSATLQRNQERLKGVGIIQEDFENQEQFARRSVSLIRESTLSQGDALADLILKNLKTLADAEAESISILGKAQNKINELKDKQEEADKKRAEDAKKRREKAIEEQAKEDQANYEYYAGIEKERREAAEAERIEQNRIELEQAANNAAVLRAIREKDLAEKKKYTDRVNALKASEASVAVNLSNTLAGLFKKDSQGQRGFALLTIAANAGIGVSNAVKAGSGIPWPGNLAAILSGVTAVLSGIGQAKQLVGFATGGVVGNKGIAVTRSNGDNRLITAKDGEVVLTNEQRSRIGDDQLRQAGVPGFAAGGVVGGFETRIASRQAESNFDINRLASLINMIQPVLVYQDFEAKAREINEPIVRAKVI